MNGSALSAITPPHNVEAEQSVLGAILLSDRAMYALVIAEGLRPDHFYRERHGLIYGAMLDLYDQSEPVDVLTVTEQLKQSGRLDDVGGRETIDGLAGAVPSVANSRRYAQIVRENALMRDLLTTTYEIQSSVLYHEAPPQELVERAEQAMLEVAHDENKQDFRAIGDVLHAELDKLQTLSREGTALTGTPSGYKDLDEITGGFQPGNLIIIAARPSMGKSALALGMASNLAVRHDTPVALFTLEMSKSEVTQRLMCSEAKVESNRLRTGKLLPDDWPRLTAACDKLAKAPIYVDDTASVTMMEIRSKCRRLKSRAPNLGLIVVDYLQLMTSGGSAENRVQEVSQISRALKILARDLDVPIIALSQLSRAVEQRHDKRPILSDLRESGSIEQDADLVAFIYRDEYYNPEETDQQGLAEVILSKHRNGPTDSIKLSFLKRYAKFTDLAGGGP